MKHTVRESLVPLGGRRLHLDKVGQKDKVTLRHGVRLGLDVEIVALDCSPICRCTRDPTRTTHANPEQPPWWSTMP
jgi:hypothetical protein